MVGGLFYNEKNELFQFTGLKNSCIRGKKTNKMKAFYSIIYINTNMSIGERLSIGLLFRYEENLRFKYSEHKLWIVKSLLDESAFSLVESYLKNLQKEIKETKNTELNNLLSEDYLDYLSRYANNILSFSAPKPLSIENTDNFFERLYSKYIFDDERINASNI